MPIVRKLVAREIYEGAQLEARHMGPDLLSFVDGVELPQFYIDAEAAFVAGRRFIDAQRAEAVKAAAERYKK